jgi:heme exporter protein B
MIPFLEIAKKDLRIEMRTKASLLTMLLYALLIVIAFRAAASVSGVAAEALFAPMLWTAVMVACVMGVMASFEFERHDDAALSSLLAPVERGQVFLGKLISGLVLGLISAFITLLLGLVFFPLSETNAVLKLAALLLLGTAAAMAILSLVAFMSAASSVPRVLLPLAAVPLLIFTVVLPAVDASARVLAGMDGWTGGLALEALVALAVTAAGFILAGPLTEAA